MFKFFMPDYLPIILFGISVIIISEIIVFFIRKKHNITLKQYLLRRSVVGHQIWMNVILLILFAITTFIVLGVLNNTKWFIIVLFGGFIIFSLFDSLMEYNHNREEKLYIVRVVSALSIIVILIGSVWLQPPVITFAQFAEESYSNSFEEIREVEVFRAGNPGKDVAVTDEQAIDQLFDKLSNVKMQRTLDRTTYEDPFYNLILKYEYPWKDHDIFTIEAHKDFLIFNHNDRSYKVVNNNDIYALLEQMEFD